ncbi:tetratricopeptide repeat protein, partial [Arcicella rigui]
NLKEQAQKAYERALMIYEALAKDNPQQYLPDVANTLNNLGVFYKDNNLKEQAQKAYERALMIREALAKDNPQQYLPFVATTLNNLGNFYRVNNLKEQAQKALERALMIREALAKDNPQQYLPFVATTLNNLGNFYSDNNLKEQAQKAYERALMIREALAKDNPQQYLPDVANTQTNYALFWLNENEINKTEELMTKGLKSYQTIAIMLKDDGFWQKAKKVKDILSKIISIDSLYQHKLNVEKAVIDFNSQYPLATKNEKISALGNGAWYALFCKEYQLAEDYARKGLAIAPEQHWLYTNLALALLLQNRWNEAKQIYQEKQNLIGNNEKPLKESFLNDLIDLEKEGIKHPDFEKVRALLK